MSAPIAPGSFSRVSASGSAATMPIACASCSAAIVVGEIAHMPVGARILEDRAEDLAGIHRVGIADDHLDAQRRGAGLDHRDVLRMAVAVDEERRRLRLGDPLRHGHRLGAGGGLVEQRGIGDLEPGQVADHGLEVQQRLEPALADLGLVGRIGGVPGRVLEDVALDRRRRDRAVIALPDQRGQHPVLARRHRACGAAARARTSACRSPAASSGGSRPAPSRRSARRGFRPPRPCSISAISSGEGPIWRRLAKS